MLYGAREDRYLYWTEHYHNFRQGKQSEEWTREEHKLIPVTEALIENGDYSKDCTEKVRFEEGYLKTVGKVGKL